MTVRIAEQAGKLSRMEEHIGTQLIALILQLVVIYGWKMLVAG
jgi:hypothetical protein